MALRDMLGQGHAVTGKHRMESAMVSERASWITGVCLSVDGGQHKPDL